MEICWDAGMSQEEQWNLWEWSFGTVTYIAASREAAFPIEAAYKLLPRGEAATAIKSSPVRVHGIPPKGNYLSSQDGTIRLWKLA